MDAPSDGERTACADCGYANEPDRPNCGMCGALLGGPQAARAWGAAQSTAHATQRSGTIATAPLAPGPAATDAPPPGPGRPRRTPYPVLDEQPAGDDAPLVWRPPPPERVSVQAWDPRELAIVLGTGLVIAPLFAFAPLVSLMGWFLSALCHEIGHTVVAWFFGMPAYPAIRLDGHAASIHQDQKMLLVAAVAAGWIGAAWAVRRRTPLLVAAVAGALVYPLLAFSVPARELLHLVGGHCGELVFATVFAWRALDGGFAGSRLERILYAAIAFYLIGDHAGLCLGLMTSASARAWYAGNGSFGLTNDYLRVAHDVVGCSLETVAFWMFVVTLLPIPAALGLWRLEAIAERRALER